jgi:hypothetical protein
VNHRVQLLRRGCFTLKFSGSWKTVLTSPSEAAVVSDSFLESLLESPTGEIGIVSSGTGCWGFGAAATSAMVMDWMGNKGCNGGWCLWWVRLERIGWPE